jgi:hypothetical protein
MEVARDWGISVKAIPGNYHYCGYFPHGRREIGIASEGESIFFHELAHTGHQQILGELKKGQDWKQEIVAELAAASLCKIVGKNSKHLGNAYKYIEQYTKDANLTPWQGCLKVMSDTEKVLNLILGWKTRKDLISNMTCGTQFFFNKFTCERHRVATDKINGGHECKDLV